MGKLKSAVIGGVYSYTVSSPRCYQLTENEQSLNRLFVIDDLFRNNATACCCFVAVVTWLILPVVICLSQRLSHACLSISTCTVKLRMAH